MDHRSLQLVAGTTYTISLPKDWVEGHGLKPQSTLAMRRTEDGALLLAPKLAPVEKLQAYTVDVDAYGPQVDQILFTLYYAGCQTITLQAKQRISNETKAAIKRTVTYMSGTEIIYEDSRRIELKVLLDTANLEIQQLFYRVSLIISSTIEALQGGGDEETLRLNEHEIDRLYHLIVKLISLSQDDASTLKATGIGNSFNILHHFLIAKRLEHLGDNLYRLAPHLGDGAEAAPYLDAVEDLLTRATHRLISKQRGVYRKTDAKRLAALRHELAAMRDERRRRFLSEALRCAVDIEEELVNITFHDRLR